MLRCELSGETPRSPVVSLSSKCVFEKRLLEEYVKEHGRDPVTNEDLTADQIIEINVKSIVKPKPPSATSIPALLKILQDEWDATMLTSYSLKKNLQTSRQELSHALYQHDAACRVISRLTKESTVAREALATLKPQSNIVTPQQQTPSVNINSDASVPMESENTTINNGDPIGISDDLQQVLQNKAEELSVKRKQKGKKLPEGLASQDDIKDYSVNVHSGLHSASSPGILCLDLCAEKNRVVTGGLDKTAIVFDMVEEKIVSTLKGHGKKINSVVYHPYKDVAITASSDATVRVWNAESGQQSAIINAHKAAVTSISLHAVGDYLLSSSEDRYWAFSDLNTAQVFSYVTDPEVDSAVLCTQLHPDGMILGTGHEDSSIQIWDLKSGSNVANFPGHAGSILSMSFSENGYYLATGSKDASVKLWDLRKLRNFKTITMDDDYNVRSVKFDSSGAYLAIGGSDTRVYLSKQWAQVAKWDDHQEICTGVQFGPNASYLATTSMDRKLRVYK